MSPTIWTSAKNFRKSSIYKRLMALCMANLIACSLRVPGFASQGVSGGPAPTLGSIEDVTNAIVKKELGLLNLDTKFRIAAARKSKWKPWRMFLYQLLASGLTEAGMTIDVVAGWKYYRKPKLAPRDLLKAGPICNITAPSIALGGTLLEAILDKLQDRRLRKSGLDRKSALKCFLQLRADNDRLLAERSQLIKNASLSAIQRQVLEADGVVLKDIRDLASRQFAEYYIQTRHSLAARDAGSLLAIVGAGTSGYLGSISTLLAVTERNPKLTGVGGIGYATAGSIVMMTPILTRLAGNLASKSSERKMQNMVYSNLEGMNRGIFEADRQKLLAILDKADSSDLVLMKGLNARISAYQLHKTIFDNQKAIAVRHAERRNSELKEDLLFSGIVGGTSIARGSLMMEAGFNYSRDPSKLFKLGAIASTIYMVGAGAWLYDTLQDRIRADIRDRKAKIAQSSTQNQLQQRLQSIEEMEDTVSLY